MKGIDLEICVESLNVDAVTRSVGAAWRGGAARVELCSGMEEEGLTPDPDHVAAARAAFRDRPGLLVMIRPRPGDFAYTPAEVERMGAQIGEAADAGADGVVFGAVEGSRLATERLRPLVAAARARSLQVTIHRAFDAAADPFAALDALVDLGVDRVLTSGTPWGSAGTVVEGADRLRRLVGHAQGRIELVLGGGVRRTNIGPVLARLPLESGRISVHAYSDVRRAGLTDAAAVAELAGILRAAWG